MRQSGIVAAGVLILSAIVSSAFAESKKEADQANIIVSTDLGTEMISRHIYGHFSEHLRPCP